MRTSTTVRDVAGRRIALLELQGEGSRLLTWTAETLGQLRSAVQDLNTTDVEALVVFSPSGGLGAGADLQEMRNPADSEVGRRIAERGYDALEPLRRLPVPTVALVAGPTLGGAMELALTADLRIARDGATSMGLPEVRLGLVPGWGGLTRLSQLTGRATAARVAVLDALAQRTLTATSALQLGVVDAVLSTDDHEAFLAEALEHVAQALDPSMQSTARQPDTSWDAAAVAAAVERRTPGGTLASRRAIELLDLLADVEGSDRGPLLRRTQARLTAASPPLRAQTVQTFADVVASDEARSGIASFFAVQRARSATRKAAPAAEWRRIGLVGGGLMATQLAALISSRTGAQVHLVEVDPQRAADAVTRVWAHLDRAVRAGLDPAAAAAAKAATTASTQLEDLAGCEAVLEAVVEDLAVKQSVWAELEGHLDPSALLLTNTSSLSVAAMAEVLDHPERAVGLHFFNPVAVLPLVEVVSAPKTSTEAAERTLSLANRLGKIAVVSADEPGFIVNRLLSRWLGDALALVDAGEDPEAVNGALRVDGLPMTPFQLIAHIGPAVQLHILQSLQDAFPERFTTSSSLHDLVERGLAGYDADGAAEVLPHRTGTATPAALRRSLLRGLADELDRLLAEGVAKDVDDVDAAMLLGAGFPPHQGGLSGLLDTSGASAVVRGSTFRTSDGGAR
ncbi:enoyl-CoA hydratase/isomerase family protein [Quadrisphaera sp. RL12-1S]|uniref:3-hydroxyacyl-CoA dehydrogenase NAD-binding domain-containing protein n=1 Tax=Quadrisphaera sp. RL12-1S TaxID=2763011 RepID=UPI0016449FBA|nr:enoyl-CoA hydratase/isomerase family protein [Quadrisphaera sp. RL12-1S]